MFVMKKVEIQTSRLGNNQVLDFGEIVQLVLMDSVGENNILFFSMKAI